MAMTVAGLQAAIKSALEDPVNGYGVPVTQATEDKFTKALATAIYTYMTTNCIVVVVGNSGTGLSANLSNGVVSGTCNGTLT